VPRAEDGDLGLTRRVAECGPRDVVHDEALDVDGRPASADVTDRLADLLLGAVPQVVGERAVGGALPRQGGLGQVIGADDAEWAIARLCLAGGPFQLRNAVPNGAEPDHHSSLVLHFRLLFRHACAACFHL
jgi:hypothetical protein